MAKTFEKSSTVVHVYSDGSATEYKIEKDNDGTVSIDNDDRWISLYPQSWIAIRDKVDQYFADMEAETNDD